MGRGGCTLVSVHHEEYLTPASSSMERRSGKNAQCRVKLKYGFRFPRFPHESANCAFYSKDGSCVLCGRSSVLRAIAFYSKWCCCLADRKACLVCPYTSRVISACLLTTCQEASARTQQGLTNDLRKGDARTGRSSILQEGSTSTEILLLRTGTARLDVKVLLALGLLTRLITCGCLALLSF